jgi:hypothetical protein
VRSRTRLVALGALAVYLAISVLLWWGAWSTHPTITTTCGCGDPSLSTWFLAWPAYAIAHGHNPFFSSTMFYPGGIDLLSNTGLLAIGIPLAPVTWLFGPVATLNVASTLGPALSALSMFWLLRRWVSSTPAAFAAGLVFGFSPFVLVNLAVAHLNLGVLALLPLIVACLDELLVRQKGRPLTTGILLGVLVTLQFFLGSEELAIAAVCAITGVVVLVFYAAIRRRDLIFAKWRYATRAMTMAVMVAAALLAYPVWVALDGRGHLSGLVWPQLPPGRGGIWLSNTWQIRFMGVDAVRFFAGYQGPALPEAEYLGIGMVVILVLGVIVWWRDARLRFFGALTLVTIALSLGTNSSYWVPWNFLRHVPVLQNVIPLRVFAATTMCVAIMLGLIVDHTARSTRNLLSRFQERAPKPIALLPVVASIVVAVVAVVPMASAVAGNIPYTTERVVVPAWFSSTAKDLPPGQVLLSFPPAPTGPSVLVWQSLDSTSFSLATGAGPESVPSRAGNEQAALELLTQASSILVPLPEVGRSQAGEVRRALRDWGVTVVAVPDPALLVPRYDRSAGTAWALGLFTLAIGRQPVFEGDTWVWTGVRSPGPQIDVTSQVFSGCTNGELLSTSSPEGVPDCIESAPSRLRPRT